MNRFPAIFLSLLLASVTVVGKLVAQDATNSQAHPLFGGSPPHPYLPTVSTTPGVSLPQWTFSFTYNGIPYNPVIVGTDPSQTDTTTTIPVDIIPIKMVYETSTGEQTFDPNTTYSGLNVLASLDTFGVSALVVGTDGQLYGAGPQCCGNDGVIFRLNPSSGKFTVLHQFDGGDGWKPLALLQGIDGNFYGVTEQGGGAGCTNGCGEVFEMDSKGPHTLNVIHQFQGSSVDGYQPYFLVQGSDGTLYGLTYEGNNATYQYGAIFSLSTSGANFKVLHSFSGSDGSQPTALLPPYNGVLYGATPLWGPDGDGEIFSIDSDGSNFNIVYAFTDGSDGGNPIALAQTSTGALYGVAQYSSGGAGDLFQVSPSGSITVLYDFPENGSAGLIPNSLAYFQSGTGWVLLGTAENGGASDAGTIFEFNPGNPPNENFTVVYSLMNGLLDPGIPLVRGKNGGAIYGETNAGGTYDNGTIFQLLTATQLVATSPMFKSSIDYSQGSTDLGKTQYEDAYERGNFWGFGVQTNTDYHLLLGNPVIEPEEALSVPTSEGSVISNPWSGIPTGTAYVGSNFNGWFDQQLRKILAKLTQINPSVLPVFVTTDVYLTTDQSGYYVGGYHSETGGPPNGQTYLYASTIAQDGNTPVFSMDIDALSHEVGEWIVDPFYTNSAFPACGLSDPGAKIEVGDPLENNPNFGTQPYVVNGFTYHPQDLVFMRYFGAPSNTSVNDWWTFQNYGFTSVCQAGS